MPFLFHFPFFFSVDSTDYIFQIPFELWFCCEASFEKLCTHTPLIHLKVYETILSSFSSKSRGKESSSAFSFSLPEVLFVYNIT